MSKTLVTICARRGSKGVTNKNIRLLNGKPLIYYTIKQALGWDKASMVVVSTDSEEIASISRSFGAVVPFIRPENLAKDNSPKIPVIRHALLSCEKIYNETFNIVVDLDVTSPVRTIADLNNCYKLFSEKRPNTLFSVVDANKNPYFNMIEQDSNGKIFLCKKSITVTRRQDAPKVYNLNASIYFYDRNYLLDETILSPISNNSIIYIMSDYSGKDIDSEIDFKFLEFLLKENLITL